MLEARVTLTTIHPALPWHLAVMTTIQAAPSWHPPGLLSQQPGSSWMLHRHLLEATRLQPLNSERQLLLEQALF